MRRMYSFSRRNTMDRCLALYFFEYYATASKSPLNDRRKARISGLKNMTNTALLAGEILHRFIRLHFTRSDLSSAWLKQTAVKSFDETVEFARNPKAQAHRMEERYPPKELVEFSYSDLDGEGAAEIGHSKLETALDNFFEGAAVREYLESLDGFELMPEKRLSGMKENGWSIGGQIDLLAVNGASCEVADWKLGVQERGADSLQLHIYGEFASDLTGLGRDDVRLRRVFLGDAVVETPQRLNSEQSLIGRTRLMQDVELMEELHSYGQDGREGVFTPCNHENVCRRCKFRAMCHEAPLSENSLLI